MSDVLDNCRGLARQLFGRLVYVEDGAVAAELWPNRSDCFGWTFPGDGRYFDWNIADRIGDRWEGPAPMLFVEVDAIRASATPDSFEQCLRTITLHELAHNDPREQAADDVIVDTPEVRALQVVRFERASKAKPVELGEPNDPHGPQFIRRCIHLAVRAAAMGADVSWRDLISIGGAPSDACNYLPLLIGECVQFRDVPLSSIEELPIPALVQQQYELDVRWAQHAKEKS